MASSQEPRTWLQHTASDRLITQLHRSQDLQLRDGIEKDPKRCDTVGMAANRELDIPQKFEYYASHAEAEKAERAYWFSRTPSERLAAAELLRQAVYGYDPDRAVISPVFEFIEPGGR